MHFSFEAITVHNFFQLHEVLAYLVLNHLVLKDAIDLIDCTINIEFIQRKRMEECNPTQAM